MPERGYCTCFDSQVLSLFFIPAAVEFDQARGQASRRQASVLDEPAECGRNQSVNSAIEGIEMIRSDVMCV